jgi:nucleoside-diphosphate-sugar epimerase
LRTLVFGLTGQLGDALRPRLAELGPGLVAVSRGGRPAEDAIDWRVGMLQAMPTLPGDIGTIVSLGPLDVFADWYAREAPAGATRVVAIGSTGILDKQDSPDADERALAARLAGAEAQLFAAATARGAAATVLRPTLLYGNGRDRSLTPLAALARRVRLLPLPGNARGLRQPVHVEDVAAAVLAALPAAATHGQAFDLPGGETLAFDAMVRRLLRAQAPWTTTLRVPTAVARHAAPLAQRLGVAGFSPGALARMARDQVADAGPAAAAFGYAPRKFLP